MATALSSIAQLQSSLSVAVSYAQSGESVVASYSKMVSSLAAQSAYSSDQSMILANKSASMASNWASGATKGFVMTSSMAAANVASSAALLSMVNAGVDSMESAANA